MKKRFSSIITIVFVLLNLHLQANPYVMGRMWGRFGNQLFIIATTVSLALDNHAEPIFPDFLDAKDPLINKNMRDNYVLSSLQDSYKNIFYPLNVNRPNQKVEFVYREPSFTFAPIPYHENMLIEGWFQSEKYFKHHKEEIVELFSPPSKILKYLRKKYGDIIHHPNAVSIHLRCYKKENPIFENIYPTYGREYVEKAASLFSNDTLFIVFSDQMQWCKEELSGLSLNFRFVEGEHYCHDFYLMSLCKHHIISNSSFSWWAAYLNKNPDKIVVVPPQWFTPEYGAINDTRDLIPNEWVILPD